MYILFQLYLFNKFVVLKRTVSLYILTNTQCLEVTMANRANLDQMQHHAATQVHTTCWKDMAIISVKIMNKPDRLELTNGIILLMWIGQSTRP